MPVEQPTAASSSSISIGDLLEKLAVHAFFKGILEFQLGYPLPQPVSTAGPNGSDEMFARWIGLLDFAVPPPMVRDALSESTTYDTAAGLLRYYVRKGSPLDADRDKTDFVVTCLYRKKKRSFVAE